MTEVICDMKKTAQGREGREGRGDAPNDAKGAMQAPAGHGVDATMSLARLEALIKNLHAAVLVEDERRRVVLANDELCRMFGIPAAPGDLVGADCAAMAGQAKALFEDPDGFIRRIDELLELGNPAEGDELRLIDGRVLYRDFVPVRVDGERRGHLWQYRDVTERRAEEALHRALVRTALDAMVTIDSRGKILEFNPAAERMFGYRRADVLGKSMAEVIVPPALREAHVAGMSRYAASGEGRILGQRLQLSAVGADGREFPVELIVNRVPDTNPPLFTGFIRDITQDQARQEELRRAKESAEAASRAKSEFLAVMSHEIRTPMNAILGMTELSMDLVSGAEQRELLRSVQTNAESLLNVINDVLDFSKMEAGHLKIVKEAFAIGDIVESVAEVLAPRAFEKGLELACLVDPRIPRAVEGDPNRLRQVLINLVGNAVKFTKAGEVSIEAVPVEREDGGVWVRFTVRDTGIGIRAEHLESIFEPFFQADSSLSRQFGGTGLGLGISRSLVQMMGGRIWARSVEGAGSEFTFELPLERAKRAFARRRASDISYERWQAWAVTPCGMVANGVAKALDSIGVPCESVSPEELGDRLRAAGSGAERHLVIADHRLGLGTLGMVAAEAYDASRAGEVRLCVLVPPGPIEPWRVDGPLGTSYVSKPASRRKLCGVIVDAPEAARRGRAEPSGASSSPVGARLLLVEDNEANREFAVRVLGGGGYAVDVAADGAMGLRLALQQSYDLIITDLQMPVMDGFEMTREIMERQGDSRPPILAFTAHAVEGFPERCREAGMSGYIAKPARPADLLKAVANALPPRACVLVVDDDADNRELTRRYLAQVGGVAVETIASGKDAITRLRSGGVSLVMLDMNMPQLDGYQTARLIRSLPEHGAVPIIGMTSWTGAEEEQRCLDAGCTAYLEKPLRRSRLVEVVTEHLGRQKLASVGTGDDVQAVEVDPSIADLVPEYLEGRRRDVVSLRSHLGTGDLEAIRVLAHNLAGSGQPYGFPKITELGRTLEAVASEGGPDEVLAWVEELDRYLQSIRWRVAESVDEHA